jgi:hypothetical protein
MERRRQLGAKSAIVMEAQWFGYARRFITDISGGWRQWRCRQQSDIEGEVLPQAKLGRVVRYWGSSCCKSFSGSICRSWETVRGDRTVAAASTMSPVSVQKANTVREGCTAVCQGVM